MNYNEGASPFLSLYNFVDKKGFALFTISDIAGSRSVDIQFDAVFVRKTSKLWSLECTGYPAPAYFKKEAADVLNWTDTLTQQRMKYWITIKYVKYVSYQLNSALLLQFHNMLIIAKNNGLWSAIKTILFIKTPTQFGSKYNTYTLFKDSTKKQ